MSARVPREKKKRRKRVPPKKSHKQTVDQQFGRVKAAKGKTQREWCPICMEVHTKNQHRFHGVGSFDRTRGNA